MCQVFYVINLGGCLSPGLDNWGGGFWTSVWVFFWLPSVLKAVCWAYCLSYMRERVMVGASWVKRRADPQHRSQVGTTCHSHHPTHSGSEKRSSWRPRHVLHMLGVSASVLAKASNTRAANTESLLRSQLCVSLPKLPFRRFISCDIGRDRHYSYNNCVLGGGVGKCKNFIV